MGELRDIKGVGPVMEARLNEGGIRTLKDLVQFFPVRYETHRIGSFAEAGLRTGIVLSGSIAKEASVTYLRRHLTKMTFEADIEGRLVKATIFNREFLRRNLVKGAEIVLTGQFDPNFSQFIASDVQLRKNYREGILPVYDFPSIGDGVFAKLVTGACAALSGRIQDDIPAILLEKNHIAGIGAFYGIVHHPKSGDDILAASRRIKYDELLKFALRIACLKSLNDQVYAEPKNYDISLVKKFIATLPFELTEDQKVATNDIFRDFKRPRQMMRLLQGDVGSGKTIVAAIAALAVVSGKEQVALMAPTEILAHQHFETFSALLKPFRVNIAFLSSAVKGKERETILQGLADGTVDIVAGTHSLIQETIRFRRLGFAVIDEQHRFGVRQRAILREKGLIPDMLFMSATPIPRTLAISIFGDMDVSSIKTLPVGRKTTMTRVYDFSRFGEIVSHVVSELEKGRQAYFIVPLISDREKASELSDVPSVVANLQKRIPQRFRIAGLHGRMNGEEKNRILSGFAGGEIAVLVSTTVVEVGVNVQNATEMVILDCERFGLSQLHQLRGRVGRGSDQAYCHLVTDQILLGSDRFAILEQTTDGFAISEEDLRQRGPGEVFGEEQTGIPKFRMANLVSDQDLLGGAFSDASLLLHSKDPLAQVLVKATFSGLDATNLD